MTIEEARAEIVEIVDEYADELPTWRRESLRDRRDQILAVFDQLVANQQGTP